MSHQESSGAVGTLNSALSGRYRVESVLGTGGMATVYLAHDERHGRSVALKLLRREIAQSIGAERFLREIRLAAKLSHPHILPLFDSGEVDGTLYYVMPSVEGQSLRERITREGKLPVEDAVRIAREVADALDYAHRHGVVHRDIKPENIMLHEEHAMVADFGIGKALSEVEADAFTATGSTVGTPAYMSPEQAAGDAVDGRSDLYSLGCVFYEMLVGEQPFTGPTVQAVIAKRFAQTPADVCQLREGVTRPIAAAVARSLARDPVDRFDTGAAVIAALMQPVTRSEAPDKSIAVLPFANMSADKENEFFADGITEEILNALAQIPELRVAGRTSSFSFKGTNADLRVIGDKLGVRNVLEGSVRKSGSRVRITAQLIDVADGYHLWSERYDREMADVFAVQDEIASAIAERMKAAMQTGRAAALEQRSTQSIEAYELYLKGRFLLYQRGAATKKGMALMQAALQHDPSYGLAWAGLADAYSLLGYYSNMRPEEAGSRAREAAAKALALAPDLGEAHSSSAMVHLLYDWDFAASEREFKRALELNPGFVQGAGWYYLFDRGFAHAKWDETFAGLLELQKHEPLSPYVAALMSIAHGCTEDGASEAKRWSKRAAELDPESSFLTLWSQVLANFHAREFDQAVEESEVLLSASGRHPLAMTTFAALLAAAGQLEDGRAIYDEMLARAKREPMAPMGLAVAAAAIGEPGAAIGHVRDAVREHDPDFIIWSATWDHSRALLALPEVRAILAENHLPRFAR
ncbi:MAG TPA: protein kinase [Gemmatimonadaceae bacterium]|nr:protein kinase [Gemmatimonadaceae bacterium]